MDPTAALVSLLESIAISDWSGAQEALEDLEGWTRKGGGLPKETLHRAIDVLRFE